MVKKIICSLLFIGYFLSGCASNQKMENLGNKTSNQNIKLEELNLQNTSQEKLTGMYKYFFRFFIFLKEDDGSISRIDSQFIFKNLDDCRTVQKLIQPDFTTNYSNCTKELTTQRNNTAIDNLRSLQFEEKKPKDI